MYKKVLLVSLLIFICGISYSHFSVANKPATVTPLPSDEQANRVENATVKTAQSIEVKAPLNAHEAIDNFIIECKEDIFSKQEINYEEEQQFLTELANSAIQQEQRVYAIFSVPDEDKPKLALIKAYNARYPNDPLAQMELLSLCSNLTYSEECDDELINTALNSDLENGAMWFNAIMYYAIKNNDVQVISAIQELAKSSYYNERKGERVLQYDLAMSNTATDFHKNSTIALGYEAARPFGYDNIFKWCSRNTDNPEKNTACLLLGKSLENMTRSSLNKVLGINLQQLIHKAENNERSHRFVSAQGDKIMNSSPDRQSYKAWLLVHRDESSLRHWFKNIDSIGEIESNRLVMEEALSLSKDPNINPCSS